MRPYFPATIACLAMIVPPALRAADDAPIPIGVAEIDVTPEGPIRLNGYGNRLKESEGVEQRLRAKALAIGGDDGEGPSVLLAVDNCGVSAAIADEVAGRLQREVGLPRDRLAICSSHTHAGPCLTGVLPVIFGAEIPADQHARIDAYTRTLVDRLENVARAALADRAPGRLAWGRGSVGFAANRRGLKDDRWTGFVPDSGGPVDHDFPLLRATGLDGKVRAVLVGYACHCTTLGGDFNRVAGDWAGYAQEAIERDHPGALALVVIGCGADANPKPRGTLEQARDHGEAIAAEARRLLETTLTPLPGKVEARLSRIELPFATLPTRADWENRAGEPKAVGLHARIQLERLDRGETLPTTLPYIIQTWTFGDRLAMVFLAGEVVVDYSLRLKRELDPARLWVNAYANDVPCYIASDRVLREGGYEVDTSMLYYGRPTRLALGSEDRIVRTVHDLLPESFRSGPGP